MMIAIIISILIGMTEDGIATNKSAITMAKTAKISQIKRITNDKNMRRVRLLIVFEAISAILRPFSFTLVTSAPKSCTAPIKIVPNKIHNRAGSHPQYAATQGPTIGAAPAIEVK